MMKDCETKYRIMNTALELIWRSSYDAVGVGEICRQAKVNKGSFYHFFPPKKTSRSRPCRKTGATSSPFSIRYFPPKKNPFSG